MDKAISSIPDQLRGTAVAEKTVAEQVSGFVVDSGKKDSNAVNNIDEREEVSDDVLPPAKKTKLEGISI